MSTAERVRPVFTVTRVSRRGGHIQASRYTLAVSTLPGWDPGTLTPAELKARAIPGRPAGPGHVRDTIQAAWCAGTARVEGVLAHTTAPMED